MHGHVILNRGVKAGLTEGITCESRLEGGARQSHGGIREKSF